MKIAFAMHHLKFKIAFLIIFYGILSSAYSQTKKIDSLRRMYELTDERSKKVDLLIQICEQHYSFSTDSLFHYYTLAKNTDQISLQQSYQLEGMYTIYLIKIGEVERAIELCDSLLNNFPETFPRVYYMEILNNKIAGLIRKNESKTAIENSFELLKIAEKSKDTLYILKSYTLLGWANMEIEKYNDATVWLNKGIKLTKNEKLLKHVPAMFSNNASCYNNLSKDDSALYFVNKALYYAKQSEHLAAICNGLNIRASINLKKDYFAFAESDMNEALAVREKIGDPFYIIADMGTLATYYAMRKLPAKGIPISLKGIELARKTKNIPKLIYLYQTLAENYRVADMQTEYANALTKIIDLKDTLYQENSEDAIAVLQTRYEVQKKENIILQQQLKIERNNYYLAGSTIVFILVSLLIILLYRNYRHVQKIKLENLLQEQKILSREAVIKAEEAERKRIAADLHDNLGSYAAAISSNTKSIKESPNGSASTIIQLEENAQNMVTQLSDTIWVLKNEQLPFTSLCDRFKIWMQRLMRNYPNIKYNFTEKIKQDLIFSPSKMLHLFLIMKECVTNSLKHSVASEITVNFYSDKEWKIEVVDNGKGFDTSNYLKGSGIDNIHHRVEECNWEIVLESNPQIGTKITISGNTTN
jgi:signal transduction histidine kinase